MSNSTARHLRELEDAYKAGYIAGLAASRPETPSRDYDSIREDYRDAEESARRAGGNYYGG